MIYSFASATYSIRMRAVGHYSLITTSECYLHSANLRRYGHKSGRVTPWMERKTVDAAGLRRSGRWCRTINLVAWPKHYRRRRTSISFQRISPCSQERKLNAFAAYTATFSQVLVKVCAMNLMAAYIQAARVRMHVAELALGNSRVWTAG